MDVGDDFLALFNTRAVVIKTQDFKENDKLVWLYSEKLGKITTIARSSKKSNNKFLAPTQMLCYGNYLAFKGKNMYTLNDASIIESFQGLLNNLETLTYSSYMCELIDIALDEEENNFELFKDFVSCLYLIKTNTIDIEILIRAFELRVLNNTGFGLNLNQCCICGKKLQSSNYINFQYNGGICNDCGKTKGMHINYSTYNILKFLLNTSLDKITRLSVSSQDKHQLYLVLSTIISQSYGKTPKSIETLKLLKE